MSVLSLPTCCFKGLELGCRLGEARAGCLLQPAATFPPPALTRMHLPANSRLRGSPAAITDGKSTQPQLQDEELAENSISKHSMTSNNLLPDGHAVQKEARV